MVPYSYSGRYVAKRLQVAVKVSRGTQNIVFTEDTTSCKGIYVIHFLSEVLFVLTLRINDCCLPNIYYLDSFLFLLFFTQCFCFNLWNNLINTSINSAERARLLAVGEWESGLWLQALPLPNIGTMLGDTTFRLATCLRLGAPCTAGSTVKLSTALDTMACHVIRALSA